MSGNAALSIVKDDDKQTRIEEIKALIKYRRVHPSNKPLYNNAEDLDLMIQDYFDTVKPVVVSINKGGKEFTHYPYTINGLCGHVGFYSKKDFYELEKDLAYRNSIKDARRKIEDHYEAYLLSGASAGGAIFALKNMGWHDKTEQTINQTIREVKIVTSDPNAGDLVNQL